MARGSAQVAAAATPNIDEELERVATFRPQGQKKRAPTRMQRRVSPQLPPMPDVELQLISTRHSRMNAESRRSSRPRSVTPAEMRRMATEERLSYAMAVSIETEATEADVRRDRELAEQLELQEALEDSRNMALMSPEGRCAAAEEEARHIELAEPPLETPEDVPRWHNWAAKHAEHHRRMVHPREYNKRGHPSSRSLSLWTSRREIGRQFGAGVELYLELLDLCLKACLLGLCVYAYSLYLNLGQVASSIDIEYGSGDV